MSSVLAALLCTLPPCHVSPRPFTTQSSSVTVPPSDVDMYPTVTPAISVYPHCSEAFKKLKDHWRSSKLSVPESWIVCKILVNIVMNLIIFQPFEQVIIQLPKREDESWPQTPDRHMPAILSQLVLHPLRHLLAPISNEKIWQNHISNDYQGPDFIHRLHIPRSHTIWKPATESNIGTEPYLNRCYDFITMAAQTWDEINMFIANTFSNFADYSVLWYVICYIAVVTMLILLQAPIRGVLRNKNREEGEHRRSEH